MKLDTWKGSSNCVELFVRCLVAQIDSVTADWPDNAPTAVAWLVVRRCTLVGAGVVYEE